MRPFTWIEKLDVEQPSFMLKPLAKAVLGGKRWLDTQNGAHSLACKAVEKGFIRVSKDTAANLGVRRGRRRRVESLPGGSNPNMRLITFDVLDCTFGGGFHSGVVLHNGNPFTRVVGLDCDLSAVRFARDLEEEFGSNRLRFFGNRMSETMSMFGEESFDAVMIDPGISQLQLEDPARGFCLDDDSNQLDLRYGPQMKSPAIEVVNKSDDREMIEMCTKTNLFTHSQAIKIVKIIRTNRPYGGKCDLLGVLERYCGHLPVSGWDFHFRVQHLPQSARFLLALRWYVNDELHELRQGLLNALEVVKPDGRITIFCRNSIEKNLVCSVVEQHPYALISDVQVSWSEEGGTHLITIVRTRMTAFVARNTLLTDELRRESGARKLLGMDSGPTTRGFPAQNFTTQFVDNDERRIQRRNANPLPITASDFEHGKRR